MNCRLIKLSYIMPLDSVNEENQKSRIPGFFDCIGYLYFVVVAVFASGIFHMDAVDQLAEAIEFHGAAAVAAVPQTVMEFFPIGRFIIDKQHILFVAG